MNTKYLLLLGLVCMFSSCTVNVSPEQFRSKLKDKAKPFVVNHPFDRTLKNLEAGVRACYDNKHHVGSRSSAAGDTLHSSTPNNLSVNLEETSDYFVKVDQPSQDEGTILVSVQSITKGTTSRHVNGYAAIFDIKKVDAKKTEIRSYYRNSGIGAAIESWANGKAVECPEYLGQCDVTYCFGKQ